MLLAPATFPDQIGARLLYVLLLHILLLLLPYYRIAMINTIRYCYYYCYYCLLEVTIPHGVMVGDNPLVPNKPLSTGVSVTAGGGYPPPLNPGPVYHHHHHQ